MRPPRIDLDGLAMALECHDQELRFFLDLETGEVVPVTEEMRSLAEDGDEGELPEWEREQVALVREVEEGLGTRFIAVEPASGRPSAPGNGKPTDRASVGRSIA